MNTRFAPPHTRRRPWILAALYFMCSVGACTEAGLLVQPPPEPELLDNLLSINGEFCTEPSADIVFPVKVLYVIDQSASLQCTDSQNRRFEALNTSINELRRQPNTSFGFVGFSSWSREQSFTRNRDDMARFLDPAGGQGPATDYQGSLATTLRIIERDMLDSGPALRVRTRYVVIFISDGIPEPRCNPGCEDTISACSDGNDNDGDGRADGQDEDCTDIEDNTLHPDNLYGVCNTDQEIPDDVYVDLDGICPEYNQPRQILQRVQDLLALKDIYSAGDVSLNSVLLFSPQNVVEGVCPGAGEQFGYTRENAQGMLQAMANAGNGTYRDVNLQFVEDGFLQFDITSLKAEQTLNSLLAYNQHTSLTPNGLMPDSDVDGIADDKENERGTQRDTNDSDGDLYSDLFETTFANQGFDPTDGNIPAIRCSSDRDGDGDGLKDCEEEFIGASITQPDTDGDNISDWFELIQGTDPKVGDGFSDLDFDGVLNLDEIKGGTNPLEPDEALYRETRMLYTLNDLGLSELENPDNGELEERHCYDFSVRRVPLVITPLNRDRGLNRVLIQTFEGPARISGVPGEVKTACFEAFYQGGNVKNPKSGSIDVTQQALDTTRDRVQIELDQVATCAYFGEEGAENQPSRGDFEAMAEACLPTKIQLDDRLFRRDELIALMQRHVRGDMTPRIPERAYQLFVPIQEFEPDVHCYRPWELERLSQYLAEAEAACQACVEDTETEANDGSETP